MMVALKVVWLSLWWIFRARAANWTFSWPYGQEGSCRCVEGPAGLHRLESEADCLAAFANSPYETCMVGNSGLEVSQCDDAVSKLEGFNNGHCSGLCVEVVGNPHKREVFDKECTFEFTVDFGGSVAARVDSCFTNFVYGYSDYDAANTDADPPLAIYVDVPSAAKCQELCQNNAHCALWTWRGTKDPESASSHFQNLPLTCILRSDEYVRNVLAVKLEQEVPANRRYCDFKRVSQCSVNPFDRLTVDPLHPHACLMCDCTPRCVFESSAHISGPVSCAQDRYSELDWCHLHRPSWTTTMVPCASVEAPFPRSTKTETTSTIYIQPTKTTSRPTTSESTTTLAMDTASVSGHKPSTTSFALDTDTVTALLLDPQFQDSDPAVSDPFDYFRQMGDWLLGVTELSAANESITSR